MSDEKMDLTLSVALFNEKIKNARNSAQADLITALDVGKVNNIYEKDSDIYKAFNRVLEKLDVQAANLVEDKADKA